MQVFSEPAVGRTTMAVIKNGNFTPRERMWVRRHKVEELLKLGDRCEQFANAALLFLITYIFLLRLPSEALNLTAGENSSTNQIFLKDGSLILGLARRTNKANGSTLTRGRWCAESKASCPVHVVGAVLGRIKPGTMLFKGKTSAIALSELRRMLEILGTPKAREYRCHDLRRGHALDLQLRGAPLHEILAAGEWRSPAFLEYLDRHAAERDMVQEA